MPPKGYKKGYIKHPETGEWVHPNSLVTTDPKYMTPQDLPKVTVVKRKKPKKDDLGPEAKAIQDDRDFAKVIVTWKDKKGKLRTTQYVMSSLTINEGITESFSGAKKTTHIHLSLDGAVLEKA